MPAARPRSANQVARLSGPAAFASIFRLRSRLEGRYVQVVSMPAQAPSGRVGYVMSRKVLRRAVDRNRLKRRLRAFLRGVGPDARGFDLVIRVKRPVAGNALDEAFREASSLIVEAVGARVATAAPR